MAENSSLYWEADDVYSGVCHLVIDRPHVKNAMSLNMWIRLAELIHEIESDSRFRVLVLRGSTSGVFSAGGDLAEFPNVRFNRISASLYNTATDRATRALHDTRLMTVAAIDGVCYGGGLQMASACDIRIVSRSSVLAVTPAKIGAVYGAYETDLLIRMVGEARTKDLLLTGRSLTAKEAYEIGLATVLTDDDDFKNRLNDYISKLLNASRSAQQGMKHMIHHVAEADLWDEPLTEEWVLQSTDSEDYREGVAAFLEKRKPKFR